MGTRADFYLGRGPDAEWLGSIAWDGYPGGILVAAPGLSSHESAEIYRAAVSGFLASRVGDATLPTQGWPWPWADSRGTDYAYAFDEGKVWASHFGRPWFDPLGPEPDWSEPDDTPEENQVVFPDMRAVQKVTFGPRSGLIVL